MTRLDRGEIVSLLERAQDQPLASTAVTLLLQGDREVFEAGATRASTLVNSLGIKFKIAADNGRRVEGGEELIERLVALGDAPVVVVGLPDSGGALALYLLPGEAVVGVMRVGRDSSD